VHGRLGALKLLDQLLSTIKVLKLTEALRASEPLQRLHQTLSLRRRSAIVGEEVAGEIAGLLLAIESAVLAELRSRRDPRSPQDGDTMAKCPEALRFDLTEGRRAIGARLPTAAVFHLYRVWDALPGERVPAARADGSAIPDPRLDENIRNEPDDATALLSAIRQQLQRLSRKLPGLS
jgi:hypothetical protein